MKNKEITLFYQWIEESDNIIIGSHLNPDGDNLGSLTALYHYLLKLDKNVTWYGEDSVPDDLQFLPNIKMRTTKCKEDYDLFIALDCADINRLGEGRKIFKRSNKTINIDHHKTNTNFADLNIVKDISSTGELLYQILDQGSLSLDTEIATGLFTAISSDTGSFKYDSTKAGTFFAAGHLMEYNIPINKISVNLYQKRSLAKTSLLIEAMKDVEYLNNHEIAIVMVPLDLIDKCHGKQSDTEGIVEFIRDIEPVEIAILLKERRDEVKVSIRTKSYANAISIVIPFGGGGHVRAAGATISGNLLEVKEKIKEVALKELENARNTGC